MVRLFVSIAVLSLLFSVPASAEPKKVSPKPVLAEMQNLFSLISTLRKENSQLKTQLGNQEAIQTRTPAVARPSKKDPSLVLLDKKHYEDMVKEIELLKSLNLANEKLITEMEQGF